MNRPVLAFSACLCLTGGLALGGLAVPLASGYLAAAPAAGGSVVTPTTSPLVRIRYGRDDARLYLMRAGRQIQLRAWSDDAWALACGPESGQA